MSQPVQIRRWVGVIALAVAFVVGIAVALGITSSQGDSRVPVFVARAANGEQAPGPTGFAGVLQPALPAVVNISSSRVVKSPNTGANPLFNNPFFRQFFGGQMPQQFQAPREQREESLGSGVILNKDGYILTNNHVVQGASEIKVYLSDKREFRGKVIGTDPKTDIGVVKIEAQNLPTLTVGDSSKLRVGDYALAIGDPFGVGETATMGIISATGRNGLDIEDIEDFIQTDAPINPGNSGGALINARGELIGINTAILAGGSGGNQGIGFAIPINLARNVMQQILEHGKVIRGWMGIAIQEVNPAMAKVFGVPVEKGALISDVQQDSPAARAGLQREDVVEQVNGQPVSGPNDLKLKIAEMAPGTVAHLQVLRKGQTHEVAVKLGEQPSNTQAAGGGPGQQGSGLMQGVQVESVTPDIARQLGLSADIKGVVVTAVAPGSAAQEAGLQRGDVIEQVNRQDVTTPEQYQRAVQAAGNQSVVLLVNRGGATAFVVVQPQ